MIKDVLDYLPSKMEDKINEFIGNKVDIPIEEIRLRINRNLTLKIGQDLVVLDYKINQKELTETYENICEKSIYSYTKQISEGFITIKGGNRVGITGSAVIENGKITNLNDISSLNFRIAREIKEVSMPLLRYIIDINENTIYNTLIVSSPGARKNNYFKRFNKKNIKWNSRNRLYCKNMWCSR